MRYRFTRNYGARVSGEVIDVTPEAAAPLVAAGVLVCIEEHPPMSAQDRAMQAPPRGRRE